MDIAHEKITFSVSWKDVSDALKSYEDNGDVEYIDKFGLTYFHVACACGYSDLVSDFLAESKLIINYQISRYHPRFGGYTALHFAVVNNDLKIIKQLLRHKANTLIQDFDGLTPLHIAFYGKKKIIVEEILNADCIKYDKNPLDKNGLSYLHIAFIENLSLRSSFYSIGDVDAKIGSKIEIWAGYTPLRIAVESGQGYSRVKDLLLANADPNNRDEESGKTLLHFICGLSNYKLAQIKICIEEKQSTEMAIRDLLHSMSRQVDVVDLLIRNGANVNAEDKKGRTPLLCLYDGETDKILLDLMSNAKYIQCEHYENFHAIRYRLTNILLKAKANPHVEDKKSGMTLLHLISSSRIYYNLDQLKVLLGKQRSSLDIINTCVNNQLEVIKLLINYGVDVNARDKSGKTPLLQLYNKETDEVLHDLITCENSFDVNFEINNIASRRYEIACELIHAGADIDASDKNGITFLHANAASSIDISTKFPTGHKMYLPVRNVKVNAKTNEGLTALQIASKFQEKESLITWLLQNKADCNVIDRKTQTTPLFDYIMNCKNFFSRTLQIFKKYVENGANVSHKLPDGRNILHVIFSTSRCLSLEWMQALMDLGCQIDSQDSQGCTALHYACLKHNKYNVELLLKYEADVNITDINGKTALDYCSNSNCSAVKFLANHIGILQHIGWCVGPQIKGTMKKLNYYPDRTMANQNAKEVQSLKDKKLNQYTSLYSLLLKRPSELIVHLENSIFIESVSSSGSQTEFPHYIGLLRRQFRKGSSRAPLLENAKKSLDVLVKSSLPDPCSDRLLDYLDDKSVQNLIDAFYPQAEGLTDK